MGTKRRRWSWLLGGVLLIAVAVTEFLRMMPYGVSPFPLAPFAGAVFFLLACVVFAWGVTDRDITPVTGQDALGKVALIVFGAVPVLVEGLSGTVDPDFAPRWLGGYVSAADIVMAVAGFVAVRSIARARVVPAPWNYAPAIALALFVLVRVLSYVGSVATQDGWSWVSALDVNLTMFAPIVLGLAAIVMALVPVQRAERAEVAQV